MLSPSSTSPLSSSHQLLQLLSTRQTSPKRAMSTFRPSTHLALEQATQFNSTGTLLSTMDGNSVDSSGTRSDLLDDGPRAGERSSQLITDESENLYFSLISTDRN